VRRRKLTIAATISLAALAMLLCGYVLYAHCQISIWHLTRGNVTYSTTSIRVYRGTVTCFFSRDTQQYRGKPTRPWTVRINSTSAQLTWIPPALWEWGLGSATGYLYLTIPIWSLAIPCTIAPLLWLRRRRHQRARGFPVLPPDNPAAATPSTVVQVQGPQQRREHELDELNANLHE